MNNTPAPAISVVVPCYNGARTIGRCLESLVSQQTAVTYEVIVVDSSTDQTPAIVESFAPRVRLVRSAERLLPGPARNRGIAEARGDIVALTDADCVAEPDWIENIHAAHRRADAVGGRILNGTPESYFGTALYLAEFVEYAGTAERRFVNVPTCNTSYKKKIFERYGVFRDVAFAAEDYLFNHGIAEQLLFAGRVAIRHVNRTRLRETLQHAYKVGRGAATARLTTGEVGYLFRFPPLMLGLWLYRLLKIAAKSAEHGQLGRFLWTSPAVAANLVAWNVGFWQAGRERR